MSNTSKVLRGDKELKSVSAIEWRDVSTPLATTALVRAGDSVPDSTGGAEKEAYHRGFSE